MKIGVDVRCLMNKNYSGVSWYALNLLEALFDLDKENQYLLFFNSNIIKICTLHVQVERNGQPLTLTYRLQ